MKKRLNYFRKQLGFTVLEIMVVTGIVAVLVALMAPFFPVGFDYQFFLREQNEAVEDAKRGVESMVKDIREAADGDNGAFPLVSGNDNEFIFYSDVDVDTVTERIRYFLDGNRLKKGFIEPLGLPLIYDPGSELITVISENVVNASSSAPVFRYYNGDYPGDVVTNPLSTPVDTQELKLIEVRLLINVSPAETPDNFEINSFVQIRNVKDNL